MASAKQIAWRKKFARMSKAGKFKKAKMGTKDRARQWSTGYKSIQSKKAKKSKSTTHKKTWKTNPHNPVAEEMKKLERKYEVRRGDVGDATILNKGYVKKEYYYIPNLSEFASEIDIDSDNDGQILFMLDSSGAVKLPT